MDDECYCKNYEYLLRLLGSDSDKLTHDLHGEYARRKFEFFLRQAHLQSLIQAAESARIAVRKADGDCSASAFWKSLLVCILLNLCYYKKTPEVVDEVIQVARQTVEAIPKDYADAINCLNNLGAALAFRYECTGNSVDLEEADRIFRQVMKCTPKNYPGRPSICKNLGALLSHQYDYTFNVEHLEEAVQVIRQGIELLPARHPKLADLFDVLGRVLQNRYTRTKKPEDLKEAISLARQAIDMTTGAVSRTRYLVHLGNGLLIHHGYTKDDRDLSEARQVNEKVLKLTPEGDPDLAMRLHNLGYTIYTQYEHTGKIEHLEESIRINTLASNAFSHNKSDFAICLYLLAISLGDRYKHTEEPADLDSAIAVVRKAKEYPNALPFVRIKASLFSLQLLQARKCFEEAYETCKETISLLPYVHNRWLHDQDQQHIVSQFSGLAGTACSLALKCGRSAEEALEILERGRGVILSLLADERSDLSRLEVTNRQLLAHYRRLTMELNQPAKTAIDNNLQEAAAKRRTDIISELQKCVTSIRQLPDFESFQKSLLAEQMLECSRGGSIVVVNVTFLRSDALIITSNGFTILPLSKECADDTRDWTMKNLPSASGSSRGRANKEYLQFLLWLWHEIVKPVITKLQYRSQPPEDTMPRI